MQNGPRKAALDRSFGSDLVIATMFALLLAVMALTQFFQPKEGASATQPLDSVSLRAVRTKFHCGTKSCDFALRSPFNH